MRAVASFELWLLKVGAEVVPVDAEQIDAARRAWRRSGKGRHPAGPNYGDCFSYALALTRALNLPTMEVAGQTLLKRLAWIARDGVIERVFYPVFPPNENANEVLAALRA